MAESDPKLSSLRKPYKWVFKLMSESELWRLGDRQMIGVSSDCSRLCVIPGDATGLESLVLRSGDYDLNEDEDRIKKVENWIAEYYEMLSDRDLGISTI